MIEWVLVGFGTRVSFTGGPVRLLVWSEGPMRVGGGGSTVSSSSPELMAEAEREGGGERVRLGLGVRFIGEDA